MRKNQVGGQVVKQPEHTDKDIQAGARALGDLSLSLNFFGFQPFVRISFA